MSFWRERASGFMRILNLGEEKRAVISLRILNFEFLDRKKIGFYENFEFGERKKEPLLL